MGKVIERMYWVVRVSIDSPSKDSYEKVFDHHPSEEEVDEVILEFINEYPIGAGYIACHEINVCIIPHKTTINIEEVIK